ncbi:hypothetical protein BASA50_002606 [Batrachochytrium salamandrivorans]|uniref:PHD-type domain-containing protein n=1 Tax=Batrachochytrium salamandrivorans TaxID=1357716 RepID=A0ABQ8FKR8_9FUNG|nr:hypothetical protein BASA61_009277 [Batrachochytrium salamandrivorans]KAH6600019.1 hypothetical protein BASA50_002606 [Batrachochytrium salamandrivorans]
MADSNLSHLSAAASSKSVRGSRLLSTSGKAKGRGGKGRSGRTVTNSEPASVGEDQGIEEGEDTEDGDLATITLTPRKKRSLASGNDHVSSKTVLKGDDDDDDEDEEDADDDDDDDDDDDADDDEEEDEEEDDEETFCIICGKAYSPRSNCIVLCDGEDCDVPVHQKCYGISVVPPGDEKWFCHRCADGVSVSATEIICCPNRGGALKRTGTPNQYIHVLCASWNNAVSIENDKVVVDKLLLNAETCYICNTNIGLTIECSGPSCKKWLHATCGVKKEVLEHPSRNSSKYIVLCMDHKSQKPLRSVPAIRRSTAAHNIPKKKPLKRLRNSSGRSIKWDADSDVDVKSGNTGEEGEADEDTSTPSGSLVVEDEDGDEPMPHVNVKSHASRLSRKTNTLKGTPKKASSSPHSGSSTKNGFSHRSLITGSSSPTLDSPTGTLKKRSPVTSPSTTMLLPEATSDTRSINSTLASRLPADPAAIGNKFTSSRPLSSNQAVKMTSAYKPWLKDSRPIALSTSGLSNATTLEDNNPPFISKSGSALLSRIGSDGVSYTSPPVWDWLMEKLTMIKSVTTEIETMPVELKRLLSKDPISSSTVAPTSTPSSALDSLLESSYSDLTKIADERTAEIRQLKQQLSLANAEILKLQQENIRVRSIPQSTSQSSLFGNSNAAVGGGNGSGSSGAVSTANAGTTLTNALYQTMQENLEAIFGFLDLPQMPNPSKGDIDGYVSSLRAIVERAKRVSTSSNNADSASNISSGQSDLPSNNNNHSIKMDVSGEFSTSGISYGPPTIRRAYNDG